MKKLPWAALALVASSMAANLVFTGCGSETSVEDAGDSGLGSDGNTVDPNADGSANTDGSSTPSDAGVTSDGSTDPRVDAAACVVVGTACTSSAQCCSANCNATTQKCDVPQTLCKSPNDSCATANECCTFTCFGGKCGDKLCTSDNGACQVNTECCSGTCTNGSCAPLNATCRTSGNTCNTNGDCCSKLCNNGVCSQAVSFCVQSGDVCSTDFECCGGSCLKAQGASLGKCQTISAPGVPGCQAAGEVCLAGVATDGGVPPCGGSCCSRSCAPFGAAQGFNVCQPSSGCRPTGELCRDDSDCCGSAGSPLVNGPVSCSKVAGSAFGRCNNGGSCREPGSICKPGDYSCNAENNCCEPPDFVQEPGANNCNNAPEKCCRRDALGIPRCVVRSVVDCTNAPPAAGSTCATSADCCGNPCIDNKCGGTCVAKGGACTSTADCCVGLPCVIPPGSTDGICGGVLVQTDAGVVASPDAGSGNNNPDSGVATNPDGGVCALYGQTCAADGDCCAGVPCTTGRCRFP